MRRNLWTTAVLLAAAGGPLASAPATAAPGDDPAAAQRAALTAPNTPPVRREEAARRLLANHDPAALAAALRSGGVAAQVAVARAVADAVDPDPSLLAPLTQLVGGGRTTDAAVAAVAAYAGTPSARTALDGLDRFGTDPNVPAGTRGPAVRALAAFTDHAAAADLMAFVTGVDPTLQHAAADALADLSGEPNHGSDAAQWQAWWNAHAGQSQADWAAYLLAARARSDAAARARAGQLGEAVQLLHDEFYKLPAAARPDVLGQYMDARGPAVREMGAALVQAEYANGRPVPEPVLARVRDLVADDDLAVRRTAINTLGTAVDQRGGPALVAQLQRERDVDLRKQLIRAVGKIQATAAAPLLINLLDDPRDDVASAAARALGEPRTQGMGRQLRAQQPAVARQAAEALRRTIQNRPVPPGGPPSALDDVRANCVEALSAVSDARDAFDAYRGLLNGAASVNLRVAALNGFAALGDRNADETVADSLRDRSPAVRLAAARAMQSVGQLAQANQLDRASDPAQEADPTVRAAAWAALSRLLRDGKPDLLQGWADRYNQDPAKPFDGELAGKRLTVREYLDAALTVNGPSEASAANDQELAATLTQLGRPAEAVGRLQAAIDYYQKADPNGGGDPAGRLVNLYGQMLDARLAARQYAEAANLAAAELRVNPSFNRTAGPKFRDAADALRRTDAQAALQLLDRALAMQPSLDERYTDALREIRDEILHPPGRR